jgi:hypothetical protein
VTVSVRAHLVGGVLLRLLGHCLFSFVRV